MKIFPKISGQALSDEMKEIIKSKEGVEIQFFDESGPMEKIHFEDEVIKKKEEFPNLKEIIIHPPLNNYNIEYLFLKDESMVKDIFQRLVDLSKKLEIHISYVAHTYLSLTLFKATKMDEKLGEALKLLEGTNVTILIENMYMTFSDRNECSVLEIAKLMNHPNLKVCIDTTHAHCQATIWKKDFYDMVHSVLNKDDCNKYVRQIHFASQLNNDGYIDKQTHGRKHLSLEDVKEEVSWLRDFNMFDDKHIITEVSEEDYGSRKDQIEEIKMLEEII